MVQGLMQRNPNLEPPKEGGGVGGTQQKMKIQEK